MIISYESLSIFSSTFDEIFTDENIFADENVWFISIYASVWYYLIIYFMFKIDQNFYRTFCNRNMELDCE